MTTPEQGNQHIPEFSQVTAAYQEIADYNARHTGLDSVVRTLLEGVGELRPMPLDDSDPHEVNSNVYDKIRKRVDEGDAQGELQDIIHGDLFTRIGIKLVPAGGHIEDGTNRRLSSDSLVPFVDNTQLYLDFLKAATEEEAQTPEGSALLVDTAANLKSIITKAFLELPMAKGEPSSMQRLRDKYAGEESLRAWIGLEDEYKRLGFSSEPLKAKGAQRELSIFSELEKYERYWGEDLLPEYIEANFAGYLSDPDAADLPPAKWASSLSASILYSGWENAMDFIEVLKAKDTSGELTSIVKEKLGVSLDYSIAEIAKREQETETAREKAIVRWIAHDSKPYEMDAGIGKMYVALDPTSELEQQDHDFFMAHLRDSKAVLDAAKLRFQQL